MRKITQDAITSLMTNKEYSNSNTRVFFDRYEIGKIVLSLYNHNIAYLQNGILYISDGGGWITATTQERLGKLPGVNLRRTKGEWILNGNKWNGEWIPVFSL